MFFWQIGYQERQTYMINSAEFCFRLINSRVPVKEHISMNRTPVIFRRCCQTHKRDRLMTCCHNNQYPRWSYHRYSVWILNNILKIVERLIAFKRTENRSWRIKRTQDKLEIHRQVRADIRHFICIANLLPVVFGVYTANPNIRRTGVKRTENPKSEN